MLTSLESALMQKVNELQSQLNNQGISALVAAAAIPDLAAEPAVGKKNKKKKGGAAAAPEVKSAKKVTKVKRALTPYTAYVKFRSPNVVVPAGEKKMNVVAREWQALDKTARQPYIEMSNKAKSAREVLLANKEDDDDDDAEE